MAQHRNGRSAGRIFLGSGEPAELRIHAEHLERAERQQRRDDLARSALTGQRHLDRAGRGAELVERTVVVREVPIAAIRERIAAVPRVLPRSCTVAATRTILFSSGYGSGFSSTLSTTEKMAVFAPIATASVNTTTKVSAGDFRRLRVAIRTSVTAFQVAIAHLLAHTARTLCEPRRREARAGANWHNAVLDSLGDHGTTQ
jgi:hypothetical protein